MLKTSKASGRRMAYSFPGDACFSYGDTFGRMNVILAKRKCVSILTRVLRSLDYRLLHNAGDKNFKRVIEFMARRSLTSDRKLIRTEFFSVNRASELNLLCDKYGSDKGSFGKGGRLQSWESHTYTEIYSLLFDHVRDSVRLVLECGIGSNDESITSNMTSKGKPGASLRMWRDYFPNARIVGIDIDPKSLFEEERIETYEVDQTNGHLIQNFLNESRLSQIDLVIDDGLHEIYAAEALFNNVFPHLKHNGLYVIEDVLLSQLKRYKKLFEKFSPDVTYFMLHRRKMANEDNFLIVIRKSRVNPYEEKVCFT
jgi:hypothetical protein